METKRSSAAPILAAIVMLLVPLTSYVAAYFLRGSVVHNTTEFADPNDSKVRAFASEWEAALFAPAAAVEALVIGKGVTVTTFSDWIHSDH
jgi:hypothetical protein